ncbi:hypothetical protein CC85DRAFT_136783 [Cutaneotrichosporon oleaginosum]|uniref:Uncharacterized protein n=1 Tax=Cutaneotrichosporon oleaginosum TaxID=879819 RepID=A0A0J0XWU7_9TREE|nr:uncharacterized protein CC85DRAFT_136783 [Cutaneotrichosporon oleaginosum]KLT45535.1 hypothetical protein CC85DRAFT_136783 [Cutaneotrichosporon oleaginosum]TXT14511.1 hypothetical protein COLE_00704 [Cutaneotrichosporon oleaginosum]
MMRRTSGPRFVHRPERRVARTGFIVLAASVVPSPCLATFPAPHQYCSPSACRACRAPFKIEGLFRCLFRHFGRGHPGTRPCSGSVPGTWGFVHTSAPALHRMLSCMVHAWSHQRTNMRMSCRAIVLLCAPTDP